MQYTWINIEYFVCKCTKILYEINFNKKIYDFRVLFTDIVLEANIYIYIHDIMVIAIEKNKK